MERKTLKLAGFLLGFLLLGGVITSCKSSHEVCPAYTKAQATSVEVNQ